MISLNVKITAEGCLSERLVEVEEGLTYGDLLDILNINPETVVILKDGNPVPVDDVLEAGDVEVIRVVSSG
ncbi:MAG: thiamine biosynthesis protein ThiS [Methanothrix sp.]|nr:MAG: thiamine biosynthesis protein ThiS [Methanothrix sp.]